jgi:hypothetical protein
MYYQEMLMSKKPSFEKDVLDKFPKHEQNMLKTLQLYKEGIPCPCFVNPVTYNLDIKKMTNHLLNHLNQFKDLMVNYFKHVIPNFIGLIQSDGCQDLTKHVKQLNYDKVYTTNYTETFRRLYVVCLEKINPAVEVDNPNVSYSFINRLKDIFKSSSTKEVLKETQPSTTHLHGETYRIKNEETLVLGVDGLTEDQQKYLGVGALGFTKYFQTIYKSCDTGALYNLKANPQEPLSFTFWGHSLDKSDRKYIEHIFGFFKGHIGRYKSDENKIIIFYHNDESKASMLKNLLDIIGQEDIEKLAYRKQLVFEPSPKIFKSDFETFKKFRSMGLSFKQIKQDTGLTDSELADMEKLLPAN